MIFCTYFNILKELHVTILDFQFELLIIWLHSQKLDKFFQYSGHSDHYIHLICLYTFEVSNHRKGTCFTAKCRLVYNILEKDKRSSLKD
jgi:hypothetical protein